MKIHLDDYRKKKVCNFTADEQRLMDCVQRRFIWHWGHATEKIPSKILKETALAMMNYSRSQAEKAVEAGKVQEFCEHWEEKIPGKLSVVAYGAWAT